jgi:membrane-associated phospholipid phosphatase
MKTSIKSGPTALLFALILGGLSSGCGGGEDRYTDEALVGKWADMALYITKHTPSNSPTYASRCLGYIGVAMYESVVHGFAEYQSLAGQLNGLEELPKPEANATYDWPLSLNAAQAELLRALYAQTSDENLARIDSLEKAIWRNASRQVRDKAIIARSSAYGKAVAQRIFEWSISDGGHRAYMKNFDKTWTHPAHPGAWQPPLFAQSFSHHPLHPHWGENRTFLEENARLETPYMIPHDTARHSEYYRQYLMVYEKNNALTQEEKEIAIWWGDDPDETFTPPGHSFFIAGLALKAKHADLITCAETYARVGMAVADAFIKCWKWKYHYFSERPNTFINRVIDEQWESFWPDPPFPSFPSGHAIQAAAAAKVMIDMFGDAFAFVDSAHVGRPRDVIRNVEFKARTFSSFWQLAEEIANSRFYGGIHIPHDNATGLEQGAFIGENVNKLKWKKG